MVICTDSHLGHTGSMSKRVVDIDYALLEEATEIFGASTMKEPVNRSLEGGRAGGAAARTTRMGRSSKLALTVRRRPGMAEE
jgi:hypothetical protein